MIHIHQGILSFSDIPAIAERSEKTVLLVRHSYRESLAGGNHDPGLTGEGYEYACQCGKLLSGMKDLCYGASFRRRCLETVQALIEGGGLEEQEIIRYHEISDTSLFETPEDFTAALQYGNIPALLTQYYTVGTAGRMIPLPEYHCRLFEFLTTAAFAKKNVILATHDIVTAALLLPLKVYPFKLDDWCGYIQGAALYQAANGDWTAAYVVPDRNTRKTHELFI